MVHGRSHLANTAGRILRSRRPFDFSNRTASVEHHRHILRKLEVQISSRSDFDSLSQLLTIARSRLLRLNKRGIDGAPDSGVRFVLVPGFNHRPFSPILNQLCYHLCKAVFLTGSCTSVTFSSTQLEEPLVNLHCCAPGSTLFIVSSIFDGPPECCRKLTQPQATAHKFGEKLGQPPFGRMGHGPKIFKSLLSYDMDFRPTCLNAILQNQKLMELNALVSKLKWVREFNWAVIVSFAYCIVGICCRNPGTFGFDHYITVIE